MRQSERPVYYDRPKRLFSPEEFARWRATIPFTDAQILEALEQHRDTHQVKYFRQCIDSTIRSFRKTGHLSKFILRVTVPLLVKWCGICGKVALYRQGTTGRCKVHRMVPVAHREERLARLSTRASEISLEARGRDQRERALKYAKPKAR